MACVQGAMPGTVTAMTRDRLGCVASLNSLNPGAPLQVGRLRGLEGEERRGG